MYRSTEEGVRTAQTGAGLDFEAREIIVLKLGTEGHVQAILDNRDLILHKRAENLLLGNRRHERDE